jgi:hypothetical protein
MVEAYSGRAFSLAVHSPTLGGGDMRKKTTGVASIRRLSALVALALGATGALPTPASADAISNTTPPTIGGQNVEGQTLTATTGTWSSTLPLSYSYQWLYCDANCTAIAGATSNSYPLTANDVGKTIRVEVTASDGVDASSAQSTDQAYVLPRSPTNTRAPAVVGMPRWPNTLSANPGSWQSTTDVYFTYLWRRCDSGGGNCSEVGRSGVDYDLDVHDVGHTLRVLVRALNGGIGWTDVLSPPTAVVSSATPLLHVTVVGPGSVEGTNGIYCPAQECVTTTPVQGTYAAAPSPGFFFQGWGGDCASFGVAPSCTITGAADRTILATFGSTPPVAPPPPPPPAPPPPPPPPPAQVVCVVPNVVGLGLTRARRALAHAHCRTGRIAHAHSRRFAAGIVMSQTPRPARRLDRGARVRLTVSLGPRH